MDSTIFDLILSWLKSDLRGTLVPAGSVKSMVFPDFSILYVPWRSKKYFFSFSPVI